MPERPPEPRAAPAPEEARPLVVTESMARLYLRQGHKALALSVYRRLAAESPASPALREVVSRLEADLRLAKAERTAAEPAGAPPPEGPTVRAWLTEILQAAPPGEASPAAPETHPR